MTKAEVKALAQANPLPNKWKGKRKAHEYVYHTLYGAQTQAAVRRKLKKAKRKRRPEDGYFCPGGKHEGVYQEFGRWYAYLHFARYE